MNEKVKFKNSKWRLSMMAPVVFIGGSIGSQIVFFPNIPYLPPIYGSLTGSVLLVAGNAIYVFYKRMKNNRAKSENND
ncbi:hypothetical protein MUO14_12725 [Halobacillus shinanisalinarum]|uniref:Uncharacterized protein n=2 Tax=Bacillaceae TaxID=186817 RepID=A0ABN1G327_9BACI|nr:hypothetical protein [Halobacillus shinanisalinarum]UOQ91450.1 hypothetical protein MUO14_12725 [Halobacillus shinanisalinarum]